VVPFFITSPPFFPYRVWNYYPSTLPKASSPFCPPSSPEKLIFFSPITSVSLRHVSCSLPLCSFEGDSFTTYHASLGSAHFPPQMVSFQLSSSTRGRRVAPFLPRTWKTFRVGSLAPLPTFPVTDPLAHYWFILSVERSRHRLAGPSLSLTMEAEDSPCPSH